MAKKVIEEEEFGKERFKKAKEEKEEQKRKSLQKSFLFFILSILGIFVISLSPFAVIALVGTLTPPQYSETYLGALKDKFDRLKDTNGKKIILVGGSSTAFGMRSDLMEEYYKDYTVVNFGLYGTIGTKAMIDLSKVNIGKGDIVIMTPETVDQSMSLYFSPETMLQALDSEWGMFNYLAEENRKQVIGKFFGYFSDKCEIMNGSYTISPSGVYQRQNVNEYGDIAYYERNEDGSIKHDEAGNPISLRTYNNMALLYDPNAMVDFSRNIPSSEFISYVNDYARYVTGVGASIYFSFAPFNELALADTVTDTTLTDYYWYLREQLAFPVISNPFDYLFDYRYFYDSNFHLNDAGAIYRTRNLILDMDREIFKVASTCSIEIPEPPEIPEKPDDPSVDSETAFLFDYEEAENGLLIKSFKAEYDGEYTDIVLPKYYSNKIIIGVMEDAFATSNNIVSITVPTTIRLLYNGCLGNSSSLTSVYIESEDPTSTSVDWGGGLLDNAREDIKIYVPEASLGNYITDYYWASYATHLEGY